MLRTTESTTPACRIVDEVGRSSEELKSFMPAKTVNATQRQKDFADKAELQQEIELLKKDVADLKKAVDMMMKDVYKS